MKLFRIPKDAGEREREYCELVIDHAKSRSSRHLRNDNIRDARFITGTMLMAAKGRYRMYSTTLEDDQWGNPDERVDPEIVTALKSAIEGGVRISIITDDEVAVDNPIRLVIERAANDGKPVSLRRARHRQPNFSTMDGHAFRANLKNASHGDSCKAILSFGDDELTARLNSKFDVLEATGSDPVLGVSSHSVHQ